MGEFKEREQEYVDKSLDHMKCNFCGKKRSMVRKLVAGPGVFICDECVKLCTEIIDEEFPQEHQDENECCGGKCCGETDRLIAVQGYQVIIPPIEDFDSEYTISISIRKEKK